MLGGLLEGGQVQMESEARVAGLARRPPRGTGSFPECPAPSSRELGDVLIFSNMAVTSQMLGAFRAPIVFCRHFIVHKYDCQEYFRISREKIYRPPRHHCAPLPRTTAAAAARPLPSPLRNYPRAPYHSKIS